MNLPPISSVYYVGCIPAPVRSAEGVGCGAGVGVGVCVGVDMAEADELFRRMKLLIRLGGGLATPKRLRTVYYFLETVVAGVRSSR